MQKGNGHTSPINAICVYCGSGVGADPTFGEAAHAFGRAIAEAKIALVYGGSSIGLMGMLARSVIEHGGSVTGIIPKFLFERERPDVSGMELIATEDMHERKRAFFERSDAFVALPGGLGTLEELVEMMTWAQLGRHEKPVLVANVKGFWNPLFELLDDMRRFQFIRVGLEFEPLVAETVDDILPLLRGEVQNRRPKTNGHDRRNVEITSNF